MKLPIDVDAQKFPLMQDPLEAWVKLLDWYVKVWEGRNFPWWFNECASVSTFAGAVWRVGGLALEDFDTVRSEQSCGRCDLYMRLDEQEFSVEAKQSWQNARWSKDDVTADIEWHFEQATRQVRDYDDALKMHMGDRLAMVFVVPWLPQSQGHQLNNILDKWCASVQAIDCDAVVWNFAHSDKTLSTDDGYYYPGVALLIRKVSQKP